MADFS